MCSEGEKNEYKTAGKAEGRMTGRERMERFQGGEEGAVKRGAGSVEEDVP